MRTAGFCTEGPAFKCQVECDGGGVRVEHRADHVMMYLDHIRVATCDQDVIDGGEEISGGEDDRVFRLYRVNEASCAGRRR